MRGQAGLGHSVWQSRHDGVGQGAATGRAGPGRMRLTGPRPDLPGLDGDTIIIYLFCFALEKYLSSYHPHALTPTSPLSPGTNGKALDGKYEQLFGQSV